MASSIIKYVFSRAPRVSREVALCWITTALEFKWIIAKVESGDEGLESISFLPIEWLAVFSAVYLFFIGPLDWFVLRALGRQPATWITFPVSIVVLCCRSFC